MTETLPDLFPRLVAMLLDVALVALVAGWIALHTLIVLTGIRVQAQIKRRGENMLMRLFRAVGLVVVIVAGIGTPDAEACYRCLPDVLVSDSVPCPELCAWSLKGYASCETYRWEQGGGGGAVCQCDAWDVCLGAQLVNPEPVSEDMSVCETAKETISNAHR